MLKTEGFYLNGERLSSIDRQPQRSGKGHESLPATGLARCFTGGFAPNKEDSIKPGKAIPPGMFSPASLLFNIIRIG